MRWRSNAYLFLNEKKIDVYICFLNNPKFGHLTVPTADCKDQEIWNHKEPESLFEKKNKYIV